MDVNRTMICFSGCFLLMWLTFKWKIPHIIWDVKLIRVYSAFLGVYNIILAIFFKSNLSMLWFIVDFILYALLDIGFLMVMLKKGKKGRIKNLQLGLCSVFVLLALIMPCFNLNEIYSSIELLCGMMMVILTPFEEIKAFCASK